MSDDSTIVITDIHAALNASDLEAQKKPAAFITEGGELNGTLFDLPDGVTTFGRSTENTYTIEFDGISRKHLQVTVDDDSVKV